jgi:glycosyltransferase involved in cell wall biosynthesis
MNQNNQIIKNISRESRDDEGIHLAIDLSQGSALTWVVGELAAALLDIGKPVSIPRVETLSPTLEKRLQVRLSALMTDKPFRTFQIKLSHYWPQFFMQEVYGKVNAELFVTNYRFRGQIRPMDMWSRNLAKNGIRKLSLSSFCSDSLHDLGVPAYQCAVVAPGYSPEIEVLFPSGKPSTDTEVRRLLVVTNSHDLYRYGTDILIPALAKAYSPNDPIEIHIKDYGASSGSQQLRKMIASQPSFPKVVWHECFLSKEDLIRLYGQMHLFVSPFRGEGYAMKIIDAMALGLPVMMPAFGGPLEYAPAGGFLPLEFDEISLGKCYDTDHYLVGPGAYWCQVREDSLVEALRSYLVNPAAAEQAAVVSRAHVLSRYTWKNAALSLVQALHRWRDEVEAKSARRRRPATLPLSVILPTKDRPAELTKTLAGFADQTDQDFELVIVNDHGDSNAVREIAASFGTALRARVIDNHGSPGPGTARNLGLEEAEGEIFLVTGDDIIPAPDMIMRHRDAHRRHPQTEAAFVGRIDWHPEMNREWFTEHIVGAGAQQFDFRALRDQQAVPFDRFYTSNVSWKRKLTADLEHVFSEAFPCAAYEDVELGYRLSRRGLKLFYLAGAVGYHFHPMTLRVFLDRMRRVGRMRTVLAEIHPTLIGVDGMVFYQNLEIERRRRALLGLTVSGSSWEATLEPLVMAVEHGGLGVTSCNRSKEATMHRKCESKSLTFKKRIALFDRLCEIFQSIGQAQEWSRETSDEIWTSEWIAAHLLKHGDSRLRGREYETASQPKRQNCFKVALLKFEWARSLRDWLRVAKKARRNRQSF